jgi:hypothetical protein
MRTAMVSHPDRYFLYTIDHGKVKTPSLGRGRGFGRDDGQRLRVEAETVGILRGWRKALRSSIEVPRIDAGSVSRTAN